MNKERMAYIAPTSELLVVRFEQNFCTSPGAVQALDAQQDFDGIDDWE